MKQAAFLPRVFATLPDRAFYQKGFATMGIFLLLPWCAQRKADRITGQVPA